MYSQSIALLALLFTFCISAQVSETKRNRLRLHDIVRAEELIKLTFPERSDQFTASSRAPIKVPLNHAGYLGVEVFTVDVAAGTPPQRFNLTLDYFFSKLYLLQAGHTQKPCGSEHAKRRTYNPSASSTFINGGGGFVAAMRVPYAVPNECGNSSARALFSGLFGTDIVKFGTGDNGANAMFGLVSNTQGVSGLWPSDGILGLGTPFDCGKKGRVCQPPDFLKGFTETVISIYFKSPPQKKTYSEVGGAITFGGRDSDNCAKEWIYPPFDHGDYDWNVLVNSVSVGTYKSGVLNATAIVENRDSIFVPTKIFNALVKALGAEYDFATDKYLVDCSRLQPISFPDIVVNIGGKLYRVPKSKYIRKDDPSAKRCPLLVEDTAKIFQDPDNTWLLGMPFLRSYCHSLEYANGAYRFGLAAVNGE